MCRNFAAVLKAPILGLALRMWGTGWARIMLDYIAVSMLKNPVPGLSPRRKWAVELLEDVVKKTYLSLVSSSHPLSVVTRHGDGP